MKVKDRFPNVCLLACLSLYPSLSFYLSTPLRYLSLEIPGAHKTGFAPHYCISLFCFGVVSFSQKMNPNVLLKISTFSDVTKKSTCAQYVILYVCTQ